MNVIDPSGEGPLFGAFCSAGGAVTGALAYGFDWFGVASTANEISKNQLIEQAKALESEARVLDKEIKECKNTSTKFKLFDKQQKLRLQARKLQKNAMSAQVNRSFGGYLATASLGAVTLGAACGSLPTP